MREPLRLVVDGQGKPRFIDYGGAAVAGISSRNGWIAEDGFHAWESPDLPGDLKVRADHEGGWWWPVTYQGSPKRLRVEATPSEVQLHLKLHPISEVLTDGAWRVPGQEQPWPISPLGWQLWKTFVHHSNWDAAAYCTGRGAEPRRVRLPYLDHELTWVLRAVSPLPRISRPLRGAPWSSLAVDVIDILAPADGRLEVRLARSNRSAEIKGLRTAKGLRLGWPKQNAWLLLCQRDANAEAMTSGAISVTSEAVSTSVERSLHPLIAAVDDDGVAVQSAWWQHNDASALPADVEGQLGPHWHDRTASFADLRLPGIPNLIGSGESPAARHALAMLEVAAPAILPEIQLHTFADGPRDGDGAAAIAALGLRVQPVQTPRRGGRLLWPAVRLDERRVARGAAALALAKAPHVPLAATVLVDWRQDDLTIAVVLTGTASKFPEAPALVAYDRWELGVERLRRHVLKALPETQADLWAARDDAKCTAFVHQLMEPSPEFLLHRSLVREKAREFLEVVQVLTARMVAGSVAHATSTANWLFGDVTASLESGAIDRAKKLLDSHGTLGVAVGFSGWGWEPWRRGAQANTMVGPTDGRLFARGLANRLVEACKLTVPKKNLQVVVEGDGREELTSVHAVGLEKRAIDWPLFALCSDLGPVALLETDQCSCPHLFAVPTTNGGDEHWKTVAEQGTRDAAGGRVATPNSVFNFRASAADGPATLASAVIAHCDLDELHTVLHRP